MLPEGDERPTPDPQPDPTPTPDPEPQAAVAVLDEATVQLREDRARLEGENAALRSRPVEPPKPPPTADDVQKYIQQQFELGEINDAQRITALANLVAEEKREQWRREDAERESIRRAEEDMEGFVAEYPDLALAGSPLLAKVQTEVSALQRRNPSKFNPKDIRDQLLAVERVVGGHKLGGPVAPRPSDREFERVRRPTGGLGGGAPAPEPKKDDPPGKKLFDAMTPADQAEWIGYRGSKEAAIKTLGYATEGSIAAMRKNGRFK